MLFASAFGAGAAMDAFLIALKIPNFGRRMFAEGAFSPLRSKYVAFQRLP